MSFKFLLNHLFFKLGIKKRLVDLRSVVIYATSYCNLKCAMCDIGQRNNKGLDLIKQNNKNLPYSLLKKLLDDDYIKKRKINFYILMTEPLLHPDISTLIKLIKSYKHKVELTTNGYLLPRKAEQLLYSGLNSIQISLDGIQEIHDKIRGVDGVYKNAVEGIRILNKNKDIKIVINFTITPMNYENINDFLDKIDKEGIKIDLVKLQFMDFVSDNMASRQSNSTISSISEQVDIEKINPRELSEQFKRIKKDYENIRRIDIIPYLISEEDIKKYFSKSGDKLKGNDKCFLPWNQFAFTTDGKFLIHIRCFNYEYGDINKNNVEEIFTGEKINLLRKKLEKEDFCLPACTRCCGVMVYGNRYR